MVFAARTGILFIVGTFIASDGINGGIEEMVEMLEVGSSTSKTALMDSGSRITPTVRRVVLSIFDVLLLRWVVERKLQERFNLS